MPRYITAILLKFVHVLVKQRDVPHNWIPPTYGAKVQYVPDDDNE